MSTTRKRAQYNDYLVYAIYDNPHSTSNLTRIDPVGMILAASPVRAIQIVSKNHNPDGARPTSYIASRTLGTFRVNAFSDQRFSCRELIPYIQSYSPKELG